MVETDTQISEENKPSKDACTWAMLCHIFGLGWLVIPAIGGIIGPLICWQIKKDLHPFVDRHGKEALNFQISMLIYSAISVPLIPVCGIGIALLLAVVIADIIFVIIAAIKAGKGAEYRYPITIRFVS